MKKSDKRFGPLAVILAGALWGAMGIFVRDLDSYGLSSFQTVFIRCFVTCIAIALFIFFRDRKLFKIHIRDIWCFIGTGFFSVVTFTYFYFRTINTASLSTAAVLLYTAPILVTIMSAIIFKEKITVSKVNACVLAFLGCICVSGIIGGSDSISASSICTGLLAGLGYALYSIFSRFAINKGYHSLTITFYTFLIAAISVIPMSGIAELSDKINIYPSIIGIGILMGIITAALPYMLYTFGLERMDSGKASTMASVEPVVATLIGIFIFNETPTFWGILGIILVISAIFILNIKKSEKTQG